MLEFLFEIFVEGMIELIGWCYLKLMQLVVPGKTLSDRAREVIKNIATILAVVLGIALVIGLIFLVQDDPDMQAVGRIITYTTLILMGLQIVLGIGVSIITRGKGERK